MFLLKYKRLLGKKAHDKIVLIVPEAYLFAWIIILLSIIAVNPTQLFILPFLYMLLLYRCCEIVLYGLYSVTIPEKAFPDSFRSIFHAMINYFEVILIFASVYLINEIKNPILTSIQTITLNPFNANKIASGNIDFINFLQGLELLIGVFLIAVIIGKMMKISPIKARR